MHTNRLSGILTCLLLVMAVSCSSCSGGATPAEAKPGPTGSLVDGLNSALPAPGTIKTTMATCSCNGSGHLSEQTQLVGTSGTAAVFNPDYDLDNPNPTGLAWAIYGLGSANGMENGSLTLEWTNQGSEFIYYVGCGDMSRNTWAWHESPTGSELPDLPLQTYLDGGDTLLVAIVGLGHDEQTTGTDATGTLARLELSDGVSTGGAENLFFLHHSTGSGIIGGGMRAYIADYNSTNGTSFEFWDHGYNSESGGLRNADGNGVGCYWIPENNTDPDGLHYLWTSTEEDAIACRNLILENHDVIAFKSCYPASNIGSAGDLQQYKTWYNEMLPLFDSHPEKVFVVMSTPPLHRLSTNAENAARARQFANWLQSSDYLSGHPNVVCFDLFNELAAPSDDSQQPNRLRYDYEKSHDDGDSHPNSTANAAVAPVFAQFLIDASLEYDWPE